MDKFLIFYSNGLLETTDKINDTYTRLVEKRVINFIFDCKENIVKAVDSEGKLIDNKVTHVK